MWWRRSENLSKVHDWKYHTECAFSQLITGQKGIGFKSVFKVTDCPEIHSNGFHLRFDKTCGPMGYILPHWAEDERPFVTELKDINQYRWDLFRSMCNISKCLLSTMIAVPADAVHCDFRLWLRLWPLLIFSLGLYLHTLYLYRFFL